MKKSILLLCLISFASLATHAAWYKHKSEADLVAMTPAQRVDEWVNEQVYHRYDVLDEQRSLIRGYVTLDGIKAMPRLIEIIDEYDPTRFREGKGRRGERFDACVEMLGYIDNFGVRLRSAEDGKKAINALESAIERMRKAGYGQPDQHEWEQHGRFDVAVSQLKDAKGINFTDRAVKETLRIVYKVTLTDAEMLELYNFLIVRFPDYPSWSNLKEVKDETQYNSAGYPLQFFILKTPERHYEAYLEFKKTK
jgi:hypothetical protein